MFFMKKVMSYFSMSSMNSSIPLLLFGSVAVLDTILMSISFLTSSGTDGISLKKEKKNQLTAVSNTFLNLVTCGQNSDQLLTPSVLLGEKGGRGPVFSMNSPPVPLNQT